MLAERIKHLMKLNKLSASAFAERIEVQPSSISHILSGRNKPSLELVQKILLKFPNVSPDWLITGNTKVSTNLTPENSLKKTTPSPTPTSPIKNINKIVIFYSDNSFEEIIKA